MLLAVVFHTLLTTPGILARMRQAFAGLKITEVSFA
jgi:hypothetical protein